MRFFEEKRELSLEIVIREGWTSGIRPDAGYAGWNAPTCSQNEVSSQFGFPSYLLRHFVAASCHSGSSVIRRGRSRVAVCCYR